MRGASYVYQSDFLRACDKILSEELALANAKDNTISQKNLNSEQQSAIKEGFTNIIKEDKVERMILN